VCFLAPQWRQLPTTLGSIGLTNRRENTARTILFFHGNGAGFQQAQWPRNVPLRFPPCILLLRLQGLRALPSIDRREPTFFFSPRSASPAEASREASPGSAGCLDQQWQKFTEGGLRRRAGSHPVLVQISPQTGCPPLMASRHRKQTQIQHPCPRTAVLHCPGLSHRHAPVKTPRGP